MGCTEPATAALAGAMVRELLESRPERIVVHASRDVIKNVMHVGIPHSTCTGLAAAVLLGALFGRAEHGLNVLSCMDRISEEELQSYTDEGNIQITLASQVPPLYVKVYAETQEASASVTIGVEHDTVLEKTKNGKVLYHANQFDTDRETSENDSVRLWTISGIVDFVKTCDSTTLHFLIEMAQTNRKIGEHGLETPYGLSVGRRSLPDTEMNVNTLDGAFSYAAVLAASASDARMAGCTLPVVINSGSGNQGVTTMLPPLVLAEFLGVDNTMLAQALALSNLVAIHLARYKGRLSALCGAFTAAIGTSCAYVYLLGGSKDQIEDAMQIMLANLTGVVCDGAKSTCPLKIYSCVESAALSARLALRGNPLHTPIGIVGETTGTSLTNLERFCHEGLEETDKTILSIMVDSPEL